MPRVSSPQTIGHKTDKQINNMIYNHARLGKETTKY